MRLVCGWSKVVVTGIEILQYLQDRWIFHSIASCTKDLPVQSPSRTLSAPESIASYLAEPHEQPSLNECSLGYFVCYITIPAGISISKDRSPYFSTPQLSVLGYFLGFRLRARLGVSRECHGLGETGIEVIS